MILSKGIDLLLAAWPLVLQRQPDARLVVAGFGTWHTTAVRMTEALAAGDLAAVRAIADEGRGAEGGPRGPLRHLLAFLDGLEGDARQRYLAPPRACASAWCSRAGSSTGAGRAAARLRGAGRAEHVPRGLRDGRRRGGGCGTLPISADHSGLAEVSRTLEAAVPREVAPWLRFRLDDDAVQRLATCLIRWLGAPAPLRERTRHALARFARERFSWDGVAVACSRPPKAGSTTSLGSTVAPARNEATWRGAGVATRRPPVGG